MDEIILNALDEIIALIKLTKAEVDEINERLNEEGNSLKIDGKAFAKSAANYFQKSTHDSVE